VSRCSRPSSALKGRAPSRARALIVVLSGPGGAGKGTAIRRLVEQDSRLWLSRSWTTRARRPGEDLDAYTFVDAETFEERIAAGGFLEWAKILDSYYGTPMPEPLDGKDLVLEIDLQGARQVRQVADDVLCVLLMPPSIEAQEARLRARGDSEDHISRRVALGLQEVDASRDIVDATVVNDDLDQAVGDLAAIVDDARRRFGA
jgi:guanylate kinase